MKHDLEQMLRSIEHTEPQHTYHATLQAPPVRPRLILRRTLLIAAALFLLMLAVTLTVAALQRQSPTVPDPPIDGDTPPIPVAPADLPPWESGKLRITSLTYRNTAKEVHFTPTGSPSPIPLSEESTTVHSENIAISLSFGTPISGCGNAELLRISPTEGEHVDCDAVYYNIRKDQIYCLSCELREEIAEHPLYLDAWVRAIIEEALLISDDVAPLYLPNFATLYNDFYDALQSSDLQNRLRNEQELSIEALGLREVIDRHEREYEKGTRVNWASKAFVSGNLEPRIEIIEYGMHRSKCIFMLTSSYRTDLYYGSYVYDFSDGSLLRLEGDIYALANGYLMVKENRAFFEDHFLYDLNQAISVEISSDYTTMVATVPYFQSHISYLGWENWVEPTYTYYQVVVYDLIDGGFSLPIDPDTAAAIEQFTVKQPASLHGSIACFQTRDGKLHLATESKLLMSLPAETAQGECSLARIVDGELAIFQTVNAGTKKTAYSYYHLSEYRAEGGEDITDRVMGGEMSLPEHAYYVFSELQRTDTRTGESMMLLSGGAADELSSVLLAGDAKAVVISRDERYLYAVLKGQTAITCLDRVTGMSTTIPMPKEFVQITQALPNISYHLYLNAAEDTLFVTYAHDQPLEFDLESFRATGIYEQVELWLTFSRTDLALPVVAEQMVNHYISGGTPVAFAGKDNVIRALEYLLQIEYNERIPKLELLSQETAMAAFEAAAERLGEVLIFDGGAPMVHADTLQALLDGKYPKEHPAFVINSFSADPQGAELLFNKLGGYVSLPDTASCMLSHFWLAGKQITFENPDMIREALRYLLLVSYRGSIGGSLSDSIDTAGNILAQLLVLMPDGSYAIREDMRQYLSLYDSEGYEQIAQLYNLELGRLPNSNVGIPVPNDTAGQNELQKQLSLTYAQRLAFLYVGYLQFMPDDGTANERETYRKQYMMEQINAPYTQEEIDDFIHNLRYKVIANSSSLHPRLHGVRDDGSHSLRIDLSAYRLYEEMEAFLPIVAKMLGMDYWDFLAEVVIPKEYSEYALIGIYNPLGQSKVTGKSVYVDRAALSTLLAECEFIYDDDNKGKSIRYQAAVAASLSLGPELPSPSGDHYADPEALFYFIRAGYDENGNYYLVSGQHYTMISEEDYQTFLSLCRDSTLRSDPAKDAYDALAAEAAKKADAMFPDEK